MPLLFYPKPDFGGDSKSKYNRIHEIVAAGSFICRIILICVYNATGVTVETNNDSGYYN